MTIITDQKKGLYPDAVFTPAELVPEALILQASTPSVPVEGDAPTVRVPYVAEDPTASFVPEGQDIPVADPTLSELLVHTGKIAVLTKMSREAISHANAETLVSTSLQRALITKMNNAFIASASDPTGLLKLSGVHDGGAVDPATNLDAISDALIAIEAAGGHPSHILAAPDAYGALAKMKAATGSAVPLLGHPGEGGSGRALFGLPVLVSAQVPAGTLLVVDSSNIISSFGQIEVTKSTDAFFGSDSVGVRAILRCGWGVIHPERLAKLTITPAA